MSQGCRKQSADGQAQFDVGSEAIKNLAQSAQQNLDLVIFSCQKASLHFGFKLGVACTITLLSPTGPQQIKVTLY